MRISESEWKAMLRKSEFLQREARSAELRGDTEAHKRAWGEMGSLHQTMRSPKTIVVREDGSTF